MNLRTILWAIGTLLLAGCKKYYHGEETQPKNYTVTTLAVQVDYKVTGTVGLSGGNVTGNGSPIIAKGIVWSENPHPDVTLTTKTNDGSGLGNFTSIMAPLKPTTKYYIRAYAVTNSNVYYGNEITFTTGAINLADNILLYLPFTGNAADSSGHANVTTVYGATLTSDRFSSPNSAYNFSTDGAVFGQIKDQIYVNYSPMFNVQKLTVSLWVNLSAYFWTGNPNNPVTVLINRNEGGYSSPNSQAWTLRSTQADINAAVLQASGGLQQNSFVLSRPVPIPLNTWTHLAFTYDAATLKIYVNGQLAASGVSSLPLNTNSTSGISIGQSRQANGNWNNLSGKLDAIQVWGRALSQEEIKHIAEH